MFRIEELFYHVDTFCQAFEPHWRQQLLTHQLQTRQRSRQMCLSEIMTILIAKRCCEAQIAFHQQGYRTFKDYYLKHVCCYWRTAFPGLVSYQRFVSWRPSVLMPLSAYLRSCFGSCSGVSFIDSTSLKVCHNRRLKQHRVFKNLAARGKTSVDWFFGFKLHLVFNDRGELLNFTLTPGNTDDRTPVPRLLRVLFGKVFGDKGYLSQQLSQQLLETLGVQLITQVRRNMKNRLTAFDDRLLLRKRSIVETIIDQLKNLSQIEHSRHRSPVNCLVNLVCGLIAYCHQPKKPSIAIDYDLLPAA